MSDLTIFTPTYQRKNNLIKLYESLRNQDCKDFEWLIVDDGSTDGTSELISVWMNDNYMPIKYIYKQNGGKQTAINLAIEKVSSKMLFIVDSDDWLTPDAVRTIHEYNKKYTSVPNLCGFSFWRMFPDGKPNGPVFKKDEWICSYFKARVLEHNGGDKAEVWFTECMRKFPFPEFDNEKYYPEDGVWVRMSGKYDMVHINKGIYIGDYLEGGITDSNISKRMSGWPKGMVDRSIAYLENPCDFETLLKHTVLYIIYGKYGVKYSLKELFKKCPRKLLFVMALIPSLCLGYYYYLKQN